MHASSGRPALSEQSRPPHVLSPNGEQRSPLPGPNVAAVTGKVQRPAGREVKMVSPVKAVRVSQPPEKSTSKLSVHNIARHNAHHPNLAPADIYVPARSHADIQNPDEFIEHLPYDDADLEVKNPATRRAIPHEEPSLAAVIPSRLTASSPMPAPHVAPTTLPAGLEAAPAVEPSSQFAAAAVLEDQQRAPPPGIQCPMCTKMSDDYATLALWSWHVNVHLQ